MWFGDFLDTLLFCAEVIKPQIKHAFYLQCKSYHT